MKPSEIKDILRNHKTVKEQLNRRLKCITKMLNEEMDYIREQVPITQYDKEKVQSTPKDKSFDLVWKICEIEKSYKGEIDKVVEQIERIDWVIGNVYGCSNASKVILMTVYFEELTYDEAADKLGVDTKTVSRRIDKAIEELIEKIS